MGLPIFIQPGWYDVIPLAIACGMLYLAWRLARTHANATGPACARCGYSLQGLARGAPCPECGATPNQRVYSFHRFRWAMLLWTWGSIALFVALVRVGPVAVSRAADIHIQPTATWNLHVQRHAWYDWQKDYLEFVALRSGYDIGYGAHRNWFSIYKFTGPLRVSCLSSQNKRSREKVHIDERTGAWTTTLEDDGPTSGSTINRELVLRMMRDAGVDVMRPFIDQEADEIAVALNSLTIPHANNNVVFQTVNIAAHNAVGAQRYRAVPWLLIALVISIIVCIRGQRVIRRRASPAAWDLVAINV